MSLFNQNFLTWSNPSINRVTGPVGGWVELGRTTLGGTADDIAVTSLADKRYYMVLTSLLNSSTLNPVMRLNSDTGNNYAWRRSYNGAADTTGVSTQPYMLNGASGAYPSFSVGYYANLSSKEKLQINHWVGQNTAAATNAPVRDEEVGKHVQTSNPISAFTVNNQGAGDFASGSEVVVLGWDPDDTHTTNFWEELDTVTKSGSSTRFDSNTFTSKKYLWCQALVKSSGNTNITLQVGNSTIDTGNNYSYRRSADGGADTTGTSTNGANLSPSSVSVNQYLNFFIINNSANEKLIQGWKVSQGTAGAGTAPNRVEFTEKWANTSNQIDIIGMITSTNNFTTGSEMRIWGSN